MTIAIRLTLQFACAAAIWFIAIQTGMQYLTT